MRKSKPEALTPHQQHKLDCAAEATKLAEKSELHFLARDLGYDPHTKIHKAVVRIIAAGIAPLILRERVG